MGIHEFELKKTDQVFSYWMDGELLHFNTSLLHRIRKRRPEFFKLIDLPLSQEIYDLCMKYRGIEEHKVDALKGANLREPGYLVLWNINNPIPDYTVIDGHHRIVRRFRGGVRTMAFWATPEYIWRQVLMPHTPEENAKIAEQLPPSPEGNVGIIHTVSTRA